MKTDTLKLESVYINRLAGLETKAMQLIILPVFLLLIETVNGLHYYALSGETRCFFEGLPKATFVTGTLNGHVQLPSGEYHSDPGLTLGITVDETFDNDHRVVSQQGKHSGKFTFTSIDSGEHKICITPHFHEKQTKLRIQFDLQVGSTEAIDSKRTDEISKLNNRIRELNNKLHEIRREQALVREREESFRDQSESTNSKVIRWSIIQVSVLLVTGFVQSRYLRVFFVKQKVL